MWYSVQERKTLFQITNITHINIYKSYQLEMPKHRLIIAHHNSVAFFSLTSFSLLCGVLAPAVRRNHLVKKPVVEKQRQIKHLNLSLP